jgi:MFS superfamily sulfate permease-like transporter
MPAPNHVTPARAPLKSPALLQGILPFDRPRLGRDLVAGLTLAALGIPEVMGYTQIIGTPVITGLYTMLLPMVAFALFGSSRHLVVSADSATAAMVAAALTTLGLAAYTPHYIALTGLVGLVAAGMLLVARILRIGFLADFLSRTVLVGFLSGVGIQVACGELPGMLGLAKSGHGFLAQFVSTLQQVPETDGASLAISFAVVAIIAGFTRFAPRFPAALLAVAMLIAASAAFRWSEHGVAVVGAVPTWSDASLVLPIAFSCFVVILAQSAATSRVYAQRYGDPYNPNTDLVGLALANVAAAGSSTFVVNGSPTKTAMVETAGGRSQVAHLGAAATVLVVLLFFTRPLSHLPDAALAAIVFLIGLKLVDLRGLREIYRKKPRESALAVITAATVVLAGVESGILLALVLSLVEYVRRGYQPHTGVILRDAADHWRMEPAAPGKMIEPGLVMYWFGAELFYANAGHFVAEARRLVDGLPQPVHWLVIEASAMTAIDFSGGRALLELHRDLAREGVILAVARVSAGLREDLDILELTRAIGANHLFESRRDCLAAYLATQGQPPGSRAPS